MRVLRFVGVFRATLDSVSCRMAVSATGSSPLERRLLSEWQKQIYIPTIEKDQNRKQHHSHVYVNVQRLSVVFSVFSSRFWTPLHARRDHDQVLSSSIMLHHSLLLILLCICYVKHVLSPSGTHCWSWGCRWHLTARRASSQSLPLWTASTEEIHLRQNILSLSPLKSAGIRSLSLSLSPHQYSTHH